MFRILVLVLALAAAIAGLMIGTLNPDPVALDLLLVQFNPPAGAALLGAFGSGLVAGLLISMLLFGLPARLKRMRVKNEEEIVHKE